MTNLGQDEWRGQGAAGVGGSPSTLLTRNPDIKSIKDFKPSDRIAVPTLRLSMQSTILGIALGKEYGPGSRAKLDDIQVQIGHPEATQALLDKTHEINTHFSIPPLSDTAMKSAGPKECRWIWPLWPLDTPSE